MIYHVFTSYEPADLETQRRHRVAQLTWQRQPWVERPVGRQDLPRHFHEGGLELYYIKDMFDAAAANLPESDILVYTNADILVRGDCCPLLAEKLQGTDACWAMRRDFQHDFSEPIPDGDYAKGLPYCGKDLFGFRVEWWRRFRDDYPDMLVAREAWDAVLFTMIDLTNPGHDNELRDVICHRRHNSFWERSDNRYRLRSQRHNISLALAWCVENGVDWRPWGLRAP